MVFVVETIRIFCDGFYCFFSQQGGLWLALETKQMQMRIFVCQWVFRPYATSG